MTSPRAAGAETLIGTPDLAPRRRIPWLRIAVGLVAAAIAISLPFNNPDTSNVIFSQVLYIAIAAMGLNLLTGFNGQVSIGHGAFFGIGLFTSAILVVEQGWYFEATIPVAALVAAAVGVLVGFPALRVKGLYLALITLGLAVLFPAVVKSRVEGPGGVPLLQPGRNDTGSLISGLADDQYAYFLCLGLMVLLFLLASNLMRSRAGRAMIAVRDQEVAASTVGVSVSGVKVATFALSAAYAGVAGSLSFLIDKVADASNPLVYFQRSIEFLIAVVIGGAATITGPLLGAILLVFIRRQTDESTDFLPTLLGRKEDTEALAPALLGISLILITYVLPDGLVGGYRRLAARVRARRASGAAPPSAPPDPVPGSAPPRPEPTPTPS